MMWISVRSSNIAAVRYDDAKKDLYIRFLHGGTYVYHTVEHNVYASLMAADSKGEYFHRYIKGWYPVEKIEGESA